MISAVPEPGQVVYVRQRPFVVSDVRISDLPAEMADAGSRKEHFVTLSSVEDEGLGEELQVIWEMEPGAQCPEKSGLPQLEEFDTPRTFDAFLDAVTWGSVSQADDKALQAPFRSGIDVDDYQLDPVVRALQMPRVNLLIADDVGLGKTIEAGLVAQELILRHRARTILIICPSSIQVQWKEEMRDKFGLEFRIVDRELLGELRRKRGIHVNPWAHFPRLITSIDFLKRERPMRQFRETLPAGDEVAYPRPYDLMICDECHNVAPSGRGKYAIDSQRTQAIRGLTPFFEHKLFLSATPHNGYSESFSALLELLDNQRFAVGTEVHWAIPGSHVILHRRDRPSRGERENPVRGVIADFLPLGENASVVIRVDGPGEHLRVTFPQHVARRNGLEAGAEVVVSLLRDGIHLMPD